MRVFPFYLLVILLAACSDRPEARFEPVDAKELGIDFENTLAENDTVNILQYEYLYNGGGVGVGDFDRNGLPDLFFSGNLVSSELYLQQLDGNFRKVTGPAGLTTERWCAGVLVGDIDGNGYEDLYLSVLHPGDERPSPNLLFLNQGPQGPDSIPRFQEVAAEAGIADPGFGTQAALLDYDRDGRLDLYVLNNSLENYPRTIAKGTDTLGRGASVDRLYRNITPPNGPLRFEPVDQLRTEGWGLGVGVQDFDRNGYPDLYIGNDFMSNDFLLLNREGTFTDVITDRMPHQSKNTMGVDIADLNNDGYPEIMTVDMLPDDNLRRKTMFPDIPFSQYAQEQRGGYNSQYVRNALQVNNRDGTFSDVALQAGVAATDWSWAPLLADFDNDGLRDIFVSNGYPRDVTDRDFIDYSQQVDMFGTQEARYQAVARALEEVGGVYQQDFIFRNEGDLRFTVTDWLPDDPTYANGAVTVDLDNDGDLDLVTNNINQPVRIYRNRSRELFPDSTHYLSVRLAGPAGNPDGLGATVYLVAGNLRLMAEQQRQRGYLSTLDARLHFGLGARTAIDSVVVEWPGGRRSVLTEVAVDHQITIPVAESMAPAPAAPPFFSAPAVVLTPENLDWLPRHEESGYTDFDRYALRLRDNSHGGPAMAVTRSGRLIFGGAAGQAVSVYDMASGAQVQSLPETEASEATQLLLFDYDGDGDEDLYVGNGSSEFISREEYFPDQLYVNEGDSFVLVTDVLPSLAVPTGAVAAADLEGDGDLDLFVGAREESGRYPLSPVSYVLRNDDGRFIVAEQVDAGMVTGAVWEDLDGDGRPDLATVGEYSSLRIFYNRPDGWVAQPVDPDLSGWWYSLTPNDLDGDGDTDLLAGNLGLNSLYSASPSQPLTVHADDYDGNGAIDPIVTAYLDGKNHPVHPRNTLARQLPSLKRQFPDYATYGTWTEQQMPALSEKGVRLEVREFRSAWFENRGDGTFQVHFLPPSGQTAPIRDAIATTLADGRPALLAVQNDYAIEVLNGRLDAGTGLAITLGAVGEPEVLPDYWSVRGDARSVVRWNDLFLVGFNDGRVAAYR
ncbi:VCBS repeat protein [Neolewinella xylanilytica]|uniref:VCBS repeat protein n=1 Tax=Neolewinella xylanilytica TaxID=1514080 RepID=A0A2S6I1P7_9BACT|nr:VCBS repeat-containing protein [Neolewinella xylanilytica]PPK85080.1 VCBS repeat protein [Neolewinella xylanilytica]